MELDPYTARRHTISGRHAEPWCPVMRPFCAGECLGHTLIEAVASVLGIAGCEGFHLLHVLELLEARVGGGLVGCPLGDAPQPHHVLLCSALQQRVHVPLLHWDFQGFGVLHDSKPIRGGFKGTQQ